MTISHKGLRRIAAITRVMGAAAFAVSLTPVHANSAGGVRVPVCANGVVKFVTVDFGDEGPSTPNREQSACHGPCVAARWKTFGGGR
jgi:hypothetical protein